jgi:hypothetical protein
VLMLVDKSGSTKSLLLHREFPFLSLPVHPTGPSVSDDRGIILFVER